MRIVKEYLQSIGFNKKPDKKIFAIVGQQYDSISEKDSEEQVKKYIDAMLSAFPRYDTRLNENNLDLVVRNNKELIGIFECKRLENKVEMLEYADLNKKALGELIANFLSLYNRKEIPNWLVASNGKEWFIFSKTPFVRFVENLKAQNYWGFGPNQIPKLVSLSREQFYREVCSFLKTNPEILLDFSKYCLYTNEKESIYYFLSPDLFLHEYNPNVGNTLDKQFYKELLYLFGLKEEENQGKKTIVPNEITNTFYSQISSQMNDFEQSLKLIIIWLNRILFLKLFEARLVKFNDSLSFKFLNKTEIPDTTTLERLFFHILAVPESERPNKMIPYLNSSLFEKKPEEMSVSISSISGNEDVEYFKETILKENNGKKRTGTTTLLDYLFEFLDAYDFEDDQNEFSLISPVVLGLIFEKINGYKDGSYYTPTKITDYMAKCAIERTILAKVKNQLNLDYSDFIEFRSRFSHFNEDERTAIREIIRTLTVADPAVGSGHFLVSALNVLLQIWFDFGMIVVPQKYEMKFEKSDMRLYENSEPFVYRRNSADPDNVEFQKTVFRSKKEIIENNLFGVDINPKSVEIARLRLWIELLKNAYYKSDGTMETLPNIDINIKEGDSLVASVPSLGVDLFASGNTISQYRSIWTQYQDASDKRVKQEITEELAKKRDALKKQVIGGKDQYEQLIWTIDFPQIINDDGSFLGFDIVIANPPYIQLQKNGGKLADLYSRMDDKRQKTYKTLERTGDIYCLFYERGLKLLRPNGTLVYITSNKWMRADYGGKLREFFLKNNPLLLVDLGPGIFEEATVDTNILVVTKSTNENELKGYSLAKDGLDNLENLVKKDAVKLDKPGNGSWFIGSTAEQQLKAKIERIGKPLKDWDANIYRGIITGLNEAFIVDTATRTRILADCKSEDERKRTEEIIKPVLRGRDIGKYSCKWAGLWMISSGFDLDIPGTYPAIYHHLSHFEDKAKARDDQGLNWWNLRSCAYYSEFEKEKIVYADISSHASFALDAESMYLTNTAYFISGGSLLYLLGLLNSRAMEFYYRQVSAQLGAKGLRNFTVYIKALPIAKADKATRQRIEVLIKRLAVNPSSGSVIERAQWEAEMNAEVYRLYGLTPDEIALIESSVDPEAKKTS